MRKRMSKACAVEVSWSSRPVPARTDQAAEIMNRHGALEIEEISAPQPVLPHAEIGEEIAVRDPSTQTGRRTGQSRRAYRGQRDFAAAWPLPDAPSAADENRDCVRKTSDGAGLYRGGAE
jgi:hypothetical protein